jgi:hypothetical protein
LVTEVLLNDFHNFKTKLIYAQKNRQNAIAQTRILFKLIPNAMNDNLSTVMVIESTGIILKILNSVQAPTFSELLLRTELDEMDFYIAIGYLLKENKIVFLPVENCIRVLLSNTDTQ